MKLREMFSFVEDDALLMIEELEPKIAPDQSSAGFLDAHDSGGGG